MEKISIVAASILFAIMVALFITNQIVTRSIKTDIVIDAPVDQVWKVLIDHQAYPDWNPFIKKISGSTQVGEVLAVTLQNGGNEPMDFTPVVLVHNENQEFRWVGKLFAKGIFDGEHYFTLEQIGPSQTRFVQGEKFTGLFSGLLMMMIGKDTEEGFRSMNEALKKETEKSEIS